MKSFPYLDFFVLIHPLLIVLVAGVVLLFITACVRVTHRLPSLQPGPARQETSNLTPEECDILCRGLHALQQKNMGQRCVLVQKLKRQFSDGEVPAELTQAEEICREFGL